MDVVPAWSLGATDYFPLLHEPLTANEEDDIKTYQDWD